MNVGQENFTAALLDSESEIPVGLSDPKGRPAGARFSVYRNNVVVGLTDALEVAFPIILKLVGIEFFQAMSGVYLRHFPPSSPLMMYYGQEFPAFLAGFEPVAHLAYLPDVARMELAMRQSYHAADSEPIEPESLLALTTERLLASHLELAPSVRIVQSDWPIFSVWLANTQTDAPAVKMQAETVLISRADLDPAPALLGQGGEEFMETLGKGQTFGTALKDAGPEFDLTAMLGILLAGNAITAISEKE